jgi:hypothetical protein
MLHTSDYSVVSKKMKCSFFYAYITLQLFEPSSNYLARSITGIFPLILADWNLAGADFYHILLILLLIIA